MWSIIRYTVLSLTSAAHNTSSEPVLALPTAAASCCHPNAVTSTPPHHSLLPLCPQFTKQQSVFPVNHPFPSSPSPPLALHTDGILLSHPHAVSQPTPLCFSHGTTFVCHYRHGCYFLWVPGGALPREQCPRSSSVSASFRHSARPKPTPARRDPGGAARRLPRGTRARRIPGAPAPPSPAAAACAASVGGGAQKVTGLELLTSLRGAPGSAAPGRAAAERSPHTGSPEGARPGPRTGTHPPHRERPSRGRQQQHSEAERRGGHVRRRPPMRGGPARLRLPLPAEAPRWEQRRSSGRVGGSGCRFCSGSGGGEGPARPRYSSARPSPARPGPSRRR